MNRQLEVPNSLVMSQYQQSRFFERGRCGANFHCQGLDVWAVWIVTGPFLFVKPGGWHKSELIGVAYPTKMCVPPHLTGLWPIFLFFKRCRHVCEIWVFPRIGFFSPNHPLKNRGFHYKPSILGYPYFWKHPSRWNLSDHHWSESTSFLPSFLSGTSNYGKIHHTNWLAGWNFHRPAWKGFPGIFWVGLFLPFRTKFPHRKARSFPGGVSLRNHPLSTEERWRTQPFTGNFFDPALYTWRANPVGSQLSLTVLDRLV